jgi:quercetin dioxygenase-like cupin family protein
MRRTGSLLATFVALGVTGSAIAQQKPATRTLLQTFDVPGTHLETVIALVEIVPNVTVGRHTHAGVEAGYIIEGELKSFVQGQPEKLLKTGDSWQIPPGAVHDVRSGARGTKAIVTYVVDKRLPLAIDAY